MSMNNSDFGQMGTDITQEPFRPDAGIRADDPHRKLTVADPDNPTLGHISIAGGTYTILVTGAETAGRYCLIDMLVHSGDGPPPHRHDFEEMFTLLGGQLEFTFRAARIHHSRRLDRQHPGER
jgi:hypothetical protein